MKFRKDFVTNSSSSSFICEISGNVEAGYDLSYNDVGFSSCVRRGHDFDDAYLRQDRDIDFKECRDAIIEHINTCATDEECSQEQARNALSQINAMTAGTYKDILNLLEKTHIPEPEYDCTNVPKYKCPICSFTVIARNDIKKYIEKMTGKNYDAYEKEILARFSSYEEFQDFLKGRNLIENTK